MGETYSDYINRNLGMAQGAEQISSNRTAKFTTQATRQLMPSGSPEPDIGQIISGDWYNHNGRDLTEVFTEEQLDYDTPWEWLQARIDAEDFTGLMIGDYVPLVIDENDWKAIIIGINTYKNFGPDDKIVNNHIDFWLVSEEDNTHVFNSVNNNNSKDSSTPFWLTSDIYAWLNALKIDVVDNAAVPMTLTEVDYTETGFLKKLPESLQNLIVDRYGSLPVRYNANNLTSSDTGASWDHCGKLWLLQAPEITGNLLYINVNAGRMTLQYPFFACNPNRNYSRKSYWLITAGSSGTGHVISDNYGRLSGSTSSTPTNSVYPCFRLETTPEPEPEP